VSDGAALAEHLRAAGLGLEPPGLEALARHAELVRPAPGAVVAAPPSGGAMLLVEGRADLLRDDDGRRIATLGVGSLLAGLGALEGEATLRADGACAWVRVRARGWEELAASDPPGLVILGERIAEAEQTLQLALHLSRLFPGLDSEGLEAVRSGLEWQALGGGEVLFREGDFADAAYLVIRGRLCAVTGEEDDERFLNEVAAGETVGEMSLLSDATRSATVYAIRDSQLARLSRSAFDALTERHPQALRRIAGFVVERLRRHTAGPTPRAGGTSLVVVPARPGPDLQRLAGRLATALGRFGRVARIGRASLERALGRRGVADARAETADGLRLARWLAEREAESDFVLYETDPQWTPWSERALRQADHVLLVALARDGPALGETEARLAEIWRKAHPPRRSLVLLHSPGRRPQGTAAWLARRDVERHHHVRGESVADVERLARLLAGRGVGLVLGGGGARGFAHLGVLRAFEEVGIPVDAVGGTSMGAVVGGLAAMGCSAAEALELSRGSSSALFDPTLPVLSLLHGRRIGERLEANLGAAEIEDLPLPYFCVATNLSRAGAVVHRTGPLFRAVRSSISLPGILPPVSIDGDLHVDGGLLDNLPTGPMAALCGGGPLVAIDVSPAEELHFELDLARGVSGWRLLWQRLSPWASRRDLPSISSVLMRSVVVASLVREREREGSPDRPDLHLKLPVDEWGLLDFDRLEPIAKRGYEASTEPLRRWWKAEARGAGAPA